MIKRIETTAQSIEAGNSIMVKDGAIVAGRETLVWCDVVRVTRGSGLVSVFCRNKVTGKLFFVKFDSLDTVGVWVEA